jgi:hypothetical protein
MTLRSLDVVCPSISFNPDHKNAQDHPVNTIRFDNPVVLPLKDIQLLTQNEDLKVVFPGRNAN